MLFKLSGLKSRTARGAHIWGIALRLSIQAHPAGFQLMLRVHVARSCSEVMLQGHGVRSCSSFMIYGHVPCWCMAIMVRGHGERSHSEVMFPGHGLKSSFGVMFHGHVAWSFTAVMVCGHGLRSLSEVMSLGDVPRWCSEVMFRVARNSLPWHWEWHFEHQLRGLCFFCWPRNTAGCDTLLAETPTHFLASNVGKNSNLFYEDVSDRATILTKGLGCHLVDKKKKTIRKLCRISPGHLATGPRKSTPPE